MNKKCRTVMVNLWKNLVMKLRAFGRMAARRVSLSFDLMIKAIQMDLSKMDCLEVLGKSKIVVVKFTKESSKIGWYHQELENLLKPIKLHKKLIGLKIKFKNGGKPKQKRILSSIDKWTN